MTKASTILAGFAVLGLAAVALYSQGFFGTSTSVQPSAGQSFSPDVALAPYLKGEMQELEPLPTREPLYEYPIYLDSGELVPLNRFKGKALLINIWASWCAPCRAEMPELAHLQQELGDDDFEVVAINADYGGLEQAREVLEEWDITGLAVYADPTLKTAQELANGRLPMSLLVARDGTVVAKYLGPLKWDAPEALTLFRALKAGKI